MNFPFDAHEEITNNRSGIYAIVNLANNKLYIGSAASLSNRKQKHLSDLNTGKHHNRYLQRVYNKYGKDYFIFKVVEYSEKESLLEREQFWIDRFDFKNELYNLTPTAGSSLGCKRSDEFRRKISEANKGKKLSDEHRNKISDSSKGKIISEKQRKIISEANKGKKLSDEHRNKISEANNGRRHSEQVKLKMSESKRNMSEEISKKMSKPVNQIDVSTGEILAIFNSMTEAAITLGVSASSCISEACSGKRKTAFGYKWQYVKLKN